MHSHAYSLTVCSTLSTIVRSLFHRSVGNQIDADSACMTDLPMRRQTPRRLPGSGLALAVLEATLEATAQARQGIPMAVPAKLLGF